MSGTNDNIVMKRAYTELMYAMVGTGITLVCAIALYLWVPSLRLSMKTTDEHTSYQRIITTDGNSGTIQYVIRGNNETAESLKQDADILKRRFERGDFYMLTIARATIDNEAQAMKDNQAAFQYKVNKTKNGASLHIRSSNARAAKSLVSYLTILKKHWKH